jgi:hypothetical protein
MAEQYSISVNLMDESFNPHDTRNYGLAMMVNETSIVFCTHDFRRNKFLGLQRVVQNDLPLQEARADTRATFREFFLEVCISNPWLNEPFKMVKIAYDGRKTTLVPAALFDHNEKEHYLDFNFALQKDELISCDHLMPLDAWQVFTVPESIMKATREVFPKSKVVHASSLLIESVWINYKNHISTPHVFLQVRERLFDLMIFDGRQMTYFNTFPFQNPEDVAYYLIFVMEQLNFNPEKIPLVLLGNVEMGEGLAELLLRYVRHIELGKRNEAYRYSYILNQLPPQSYFALLNFFSCGL